MSKIKVLVVEDSALIAEDIAYKLGKHHFEVMEIFDKGEDALEFLKKNEPDLVLLDIKLAGALDGISTGYMIQNNYTLPIMLRKMPFLLLCSRRASTPSMRA